MQLSFKKRYRSTTADKLSSPQLPRSIVVHLDKGQSTVGPTIKIFLGPNYISDYFDIMFLLAPSRLNSARTVFQS